ncbi:flagellar basal body-associated protein FliL [Ruegeria sp. R13_0]|uniref:flagellar basal body-associated protein FliL n=1 Tax=Ruegeria sp. R13_0 TaxID=2821099 RepID=UPI001ADCDE6C|nr:flagellar basal body-associated protein FliL [Ruegeria sp. R13_0]MBO9434575.1 flagellar basal body-associated protein FliL [Ruegeria sp. R13_0]
MIKKLLPVIFLVIGTGAGIGAGKFLGGGEAKVGFDKTEKVEKTDKETKEKPAKSKEKDKGKKSEGGGFEYLKLTKQFVVPIVEDEEISALVTMSLSLEANSAITETFYAIEPKLRDGFLQVLFDHANTGGFDGAFTHSDNLSTLRKSLLEVAKKDLGDDVSKVLIMSVSRQDT